jgi:hypothetical protein
MQYKYSKLQENLNLELISFFVFPFSHVHDLPREGRPIQRRQQEAPETRRNSDTVVGTNLHQTVQNR